MATAKRVSCEICRRPSTACFCPSLPLVKVALSSVFKIFILQHPKERKHKLRTGNISHLCLEGVSTCVGRRFEGPEAMARYPDLHTSLSTKSNILVLFPTRDAEDIEAVTAVTNRGDDFSGYTIILIDSTWNYAKEMFAANSFLQSSKVKLVQLPASSGCGVFQPVRHGPGSGCLCTHECLVRALSIIEGPDWKNQYEATLLRPLDFIVKFQERCRSDKSKRQTTTTEDNIHVKKHRNF